MEKKNKMFNWLSEDAKKKCEELTCMNLDEFRTCYIKEKFDEGFVYVFSPQISIVDIDNTGRVHQYNLPGDAGDWTDDEDSYVIVIAPSPILDIKKSQILFCLRIFKYTDLDKELYFGSLICNNNGIFILDPNAINEINKIKENLASSVEECTYILQNYYTTKRPHTIYIK